MKQNPTKSEDLETNQIVLSALCSSNAAFDYPLTAAPMQRIVVKARQDIWLVQHGGFPEFLPHARKDLPVTPAGRLGPLLYCQCRRAWEDRAPLSAALMPTRLNSKLTGFLCLSRRQTTARSRATQRSELLRFQRFHAQHRPLQLSCHGRVLHHLLSPPRRGARRRGHPRRLRGHQQPAALWLRHRITPARQKGAPAHLVRHPPSHFLLSQCRADIYHPPA
ncbi:hypothetical protein BD309DRAFT_133769 [Dichomitus squalens]|nr:hypothetical protein BD309DRAFT_133769 [Dichomitus squalens]